MKCKQWKISLHSFGCVEVFLKVNLESILDRVPAPAARAPSDWGGVRAREKQWQYDATQQAARRRTRTVRCRATAQTRLPALVTAVEGICGTKPTLIRKDNSYSSVSVRNAKFDLMSPIEKRSCVSCRRRPVKDAFCRWNDSLPPVLVYPVRWCWCDATLLFMHCAASNSCAGILTCFIFGKLSQRMWPFDDWVCQFSLMPTNSCRNDLCKKPFSTSFLLVFITVIATTNKICTTDSSTYHRWKNASKRVSTSLYMLQSISLSVTTKFK